MKVLILLGFFCACVTLSYAATDRVICYFASWTIYRQGNGKYDANDTDASLCTHILYAFVGISGDDGSLRVLDDWEIDGLHGIEKLMGLKKDNPDLKILVSMGGWNEGSMKYSDVAASPAKRAKLIETTLKFIEKYGFDGFDLDWEYPCQRNGKPEDMENFVTMLGELKAALNAKGYLLSAAVAGAGPSIDKSYDVPRVVANLDMVNVMAYDFHGAFEPFVGHHSPLYASHLDVTEAQKQINVDAGIRHWIKRGADPQKLNLGLGLYGRTFSLADPKNGTLYAKTYGGGEGGPYTMTRGILGYNEICELHSDMPRFWDDEQKVPHKHKGDQWYGYEDTESLTIKAEYAKKMNLGGLMVWSLDTDDFRNICGGGRFPLLTAINKALGRK